MKQLAIVAWCVIILIFFGTVKSLSLFGVILGALLLFFFIIYVLEFWNPNWWKDSKIRDKIMNMLMDM